MLNCDAKKALDLMPEQRYEQILEKYKISFNTVNSDYDVNKSKIKLNDFCSFMKKTLIQIKVIINNPRILKI